MNGKKLSQIAINEIAQARQERMERLAIDALKCSHERVTSLEVSLKEAQDHHVKLVQAIDSGKFFDRPEFNGGYQQ